MMTRPKDYVIYIGSMGIPTGHISTTWNRQERDERTGEMRSHPKPGIVGIFEHFASTDLFWPYQPQPASAQIADLYHNRIIGQPGRPQDNDAQGRGASKEDYTIARAKVN